MDILIGLPYMSSDWIIHRLLLYLLIIFSLDILAGTLVTFQLNVSRTFTLPRMGYRRWWLHIVKYCTVICCTYTLLLSISALMVRPVHIVLTAAILFFFHVLLFTLVQSCMLMAMDSGMIVFSAMADLRVSSLFFSQYLPAIGKWLPGNWGMWIRCDLYDKIGFPVGTVSAIEVALITFIIWIGPKIAKKTV